MRVHAKLRMTAAVLCTLGAMLCSGCATGLKSSPVKSGVAAPDGLVYYLPIKDVIVTVTVTVDAKNVRSETVAAEESAARADAAHAFAITIPRNPIGTNEGVVGINSRGLLSSETTTSTTSSFTDILKSAAGLAGTLRELDNAPSAQPCPVGVSKKTFVIDGAALKTLCDWTIVIARLDSTPLPSDTARTATDSKGLFYRNELAYQVTVTKTNANATNATSANDMRTFVVHSAAGSPTYFLPLAGSTFGNNSSAFTFVDGVPTKYKQTIAGEVQGALSAPATVVGAYFDAIGNAFDRKKTVLEKEGALLAQQNALALSEAKHTACAKVVAASSDLAAIRAACAP